MFCGAGGYWSEGDSGYFAALQRPPTTQPVNRDFDYFRNVDLNDPLAFPVRSPELMSGFPPSLLITSTRDSALSSVVHTHSVLIQQGVPAELHVWEGLGHGFFVDPNLPQSRDVYEITTKFFSNH